MTESSLSVEGTDKMKWFAFSIICAVLQISYQNPRKHWTLLPNILVLEVDGTLGEQNLLCMESPQELIVSANQSQEIFWKKNGIEQAQRGNSYRVQLEESLGGGNYTCHSEDGSLLNHTVVLIKEDESKRRKILVKTDEDYLKCTAQNYNGEFHCSWTWHGSRSGRVAFVNAHRVPDCNTKCSVDTSGEWTCSSGHGNFSCTVNDNKISCLDKQHCPYAEESKQICVTVFVLSQHFLLEEYFKRFYLSDIVKPDKVEIAQVNTTVIQWSYPRSWSSPYSYFPLTFQIAQLKDGCERCDSPCNNYEALTVHSTDTQFKVKHRAKAVCIRAKDAFAFSQWSEWSHKRLVPLVKKHHDLS
ncbi:solute carrier family 6 (neurotransmitter transporter, GABA) member 13 [Sarotherodon galilaeus]